MQGRFCVEVILQFTTRLPYSPLRNSRSPASRLQKWGQARGSESRWRVEAGFATAAEWKQLISRHAGFFSYNPDARAYCMITIPAPWRDTPGPTWQLVAAMLRNQHRRFSEKPPPRPTQERLPLL
jgi:hypothetical protein